jgi:hypothetical protein
MSEKKEKTKNLHALNKRYRARFTYTRLAREAFKQGDFVTAIKNYNEYLKTMGDIHDQDPLELSPEIFDPQKDVSEMLLVSHIYWELAKIYDMTPKLQGEFAKVINQFIVFTVNQPFQFVNAEILRKHLKQPGITNYAEFRAAYDKIFIESDKCFISTLCFGNDHQVTNDLRLIKRFLEKSKIGIILISIYYRTSSKVVSLASNNQSFSSFIKTIFYLPLIVSSKLSRVIFK